MRKLLIASLLSGLGTTAMAQTNVQVYGLADMYLGHGKSSNTYKQTRANEGGYAATQLGFRGTEDLGGGLKALFNFEMGISMDTGNGNLPGPNLSFTRQSWVGLGGGWGTVTMGRQYTPLFRVTWRPDPYGVNSIFSPIVLWAQTQGQTGLLPWASRADNAVMYASPTNLPIQGALMYAPGEATAPSTRSGDYYGGSLTYSQGPLWVGYGFQQRKSGNAAAPVPSPTKTTAQALAVNYQTNQFRLGASYGEQDSDVAGSPKAKLLSLHGEYRITGNQQIGATYTRRDVSGTSNDNDALLLGYNYDLSRRTALYARLLMLRNKANASVSLGGVTVAPGSGNDSRLIGFGMIHRF